MSEADKAPTPKADEPAESEADALRREARAEAEACEACRLEPCSPEHYAARGYDPAHFADAVAQARNEREDKAAAEATVKAEAEAAAAAVERERVEAEAKAANNAAAEKEREARAEAEAKAKAEAKAAERAGQRDAAKRLDAKPRPGHVFVTVTELAGRVAVGDGAAYREYRVGELLEMIESVAKPMLALGHLKLAE